MRPGKQFEEAVYRFVQQLGQPSASVLFDHKVPDRDTGTARQVDAWVETKFMGHYPLSVLISCKDWKEPVNIDDIGCLCDQIRSTGANLGIIYARTGFTAPAILKAKKHGISCCRLYENQPADTPDVLIFTSYCALPSIHYTVEGKWGTAPDSKWRDLLSRTVPFEGNRVQITKRLATVLEELQRPTAEMVSQGFPEPRSVSLAVVCEPEELNVTIHLRCDWKLYRGKMEAHRVEGSYCVSDGNFVGSQSGPSIDTQGRHPGVDWEEVDPATEPMASRVVAIMYNDAARFEEWLRESLWERPIYS